MFAILLNFDEYQLNNLVGKLITLNDFYCVTAVLGYLQLSYCQSSIIII